MDVVIISRHAAAIDFCLSRWHEAVTAAADQVGCRSDLDKLDGGRVPRVITGNATAEDVAGNVVVGNVPLKLAALARLVLAVEFDGTPPRGGEYTASDMEAAGAKLRPYVVTSGVLTPDDHYRHGLDGGH